MLHVAAPVQPPQSHTLSIGEIRRNHSSYHHHIRAIYPLFVRQRLLVGQKGATSASSSPESHPPRAGKLGNDSAEYVHMRITAPTPTTQRLPRGVSRKEIRSKLSAMADTKELRREVCLYPSMPLCERLSGYPFHEVVLTYYFILDAEQCREWRSLGGEAVERMRRRARNCAEPGGATA